jgi:hypothetical protein
MSFQCRLVLATVLCSVAAASAATAQTAIVRSAPAGASIEVTMNGSAPVTAKTDGYGDARVTVPALGRDTEVQIHVDVCGENTVKVFINEPGQPPAGSGAGCTRKDMWGVYIMRAATTFVVEINGTDSSVFVAQGAPPAAWLQRGNMRITKLPWGTPGRGLALTFGGGASSFGAAGTKACGSITTCTSDDAGLALHLGGEFWITKNIAVQGSYLRPANVSATGSGAGFTFETRRTMRLATVGAKAGVPVGYGRIYAIGGAVRHESTSLTTETVDALTVTVNDVTQTIAGGTQEFGEKTRGWNWMLGGGAELWVSKWVGLYAEFTRVKLKGSPVSGGDGGIDEQGTFIVGGFRARLWK